MLSSLGGSTSIHIHLGPFSHCIVIGCLGVLHLQEPVSLPGPRLALSFLCVRREDKHKEMSASLRTVVDNIGVRFPG